MPKLLSSSKDEKDILLFVSKGEHKEPSSVSLSKPESQAGLELPNGDINWMCSCLGDMATGPCGIEFRDAFACYHNSKTIPQGKDCLEKFHAMQDCMQQYPQTYRKEDMPKKTLDGLPSVNL